MNAHRELGKGSGVNEAVENTKKKAKPKISPNGENSNSAEGAFK